MIYDIENSFFETLQGISVYSSEEKLKCRQEILSKLSLKLKYVCFFCDSIYTIHAFRPFQEMLLTTRSCGKMSPHFEINELCLSTVLRDVLAKAMKN